MPTARINGINLFHESFGQGEPVVFANGILMTTQSWSFQTRFLQRHFRCILYDMRGQLRSDKPDEPYSMEQHADDLAALLDHLGVDRCHLVGTSYGGEVGLSFAERHPERLRSLSVIASLARSEPLFQAQVASWRDVGLSAPRALFGVTLPYYFSNDFLARHGAALRARDGDISDQPPAFFRGFARLCDALIEFDISEQLAQITTPTLAVAAEFDLIKPPACSEFIAESIPGAELLVVPDAGHAVILERPDEVNTAIYGFLQKHSGMD